MKKERHFSLKYKLMLFLIPVVIVIFMTILQLNINTLKSGLSRDLEHELEGVGNLTVMQLDPTLITSLVSQPGKDNPDFRKVQDQLNYIQKVQGTMNSAYIWRIQDSKPYSVVFTSDLSDAETDFTKPVTGLSPVNLNAALKAFDTGTRQITPKYKDDLGSWRTIMLPIRSDGKVIAVLGIDYSAEYINDVVSASRTKQIIITLLGIAITGIIIYAVVHRLLHPLRHIVRMANKIADGDLSTQDFSSASKDEIGQLFNSISKMNNHLRTLIQSIQEQSKLMISSSEQLSIGAAETESYSLAVTKDIAEVAGQTTTTSKVADETVTVLEETALGIQRIAESTSSASEESDQMAEEAASGHRVLQDMTSQMEAINISVGNISDVLGNLNQRIAEIGTFSDLIAEVSQRTNLLSLNASIEAARAGEHGAGFAVVASEIRKLAESTKQSAAGISDLVSSIQESTQHSLSAAEQGQLEATRGKSLVSDAGLSFSRILSSTSNVAMQMQEISASLQQISASSEEATASITELKYAAGSIARTSAQVSDAAGNQLDFIQEISKSAQSLSAVSRQLQELIMMFKV